jgi:hypothetical protein
MRTVSYSALKDVYHFLPHFNLNTDINSDVLKYKYKTDISDSDSNSNIYSIYRIIFNYFINHFQYKIIIYVQTKI